MNNFPHFYFSVHFQVSRVINRFLIDYDVLNRSPEYFEAKMVLDFPLCNPQNKNKTIIFENICLQFAYVKSHHFPRCQQSLFFKSSTATVGDVLEKNSQNIFLTYLTCFDGIIRSQTKTLVFTDFLSCIPFETYS